ncbi:MAG: pilus assembly protein PilP [Kofleriaceae bacterium]|nr:pilus assembly protein PilP [Kofleriaceae bacterium]
MRAARVMWMLALVGCGGEEDAAPPPPPQPGAKPAAPPAAAAAPAPAGPAGKLKIEDRVQSETEKASIRRKFRESDFAAELNNRDPFMSFVINQPGLEDGSKPTLEIDKLCTKPEQFVASTFSYADLKLVGIVTQGAQRRALMMDPANMGQTIKKGDCVGREKALVKDIGDGFITFAVRPEIAVNGQEKSVQEESKYLRPGKFEVSSQPTTSQEAPKAGVPVVAPPGATRGVPVESPPAEKK